MVEVRAPAGHEDNLRVGGVDPNSNLTDLGWALSSFFFFCLVGPARRAYRTRPSQVKKTLPKPKLFDLRSPFFFECAAATHPQLLTWYYCYG